MNPTVRPITNPVALTLRLRAITINTPPSAGTPEFASPEQFAGVPVDIRSDLYSLGVTLWQMVTGKTPFRGTPGEVMSQHQRAPLPLEQLEAVPQPVVVLLEVLLEKDPAWRFQNPAELLKAIPTITGAIDGRRRITRQNLQKTPSAASRVGTRKPPAFAHPAPSRLPPAAGAPRSAVAELGVVRRRSRAGKLPHVDCLAHE
jgi:eukaryotic-like serine/threonine-protein kinase